MPVSIMSSQLFMNAFNTGDFTGWPEFVRFDDGTQGSILPLSVKGTTRNVYSIIAKSDDPESRCVFLLEVKQMRDELQHLQNRFPIKDAFFNDEAGQERLGIEIDYGEHIVIDAVARPAMKLEGMEPPDQDPNEEDCDDPPMDAYEGTSFLSRMAEKTKLRRLSRENTRHARENMPPQDRTRIKL